MVNAKQLTGQFCIDDLHCSHKDGEVINNLITNSNNKFKTKFNELLVCKGKVHDYLGINIDYTNKEYVKFIMYDFIKYILKEVRKDMNGLLPWLAGDKLFEVNHESPRLSEVDAD